MATYHQTKSGIHIECAPGKVSVVNDPPHRCRSVITFGSREAAEECLAGMKARGKGDHAYIVDMTGG